MECKIHQNDYGGGTGEYALGPPLQSLSSALIKAFEQSKVFINSEKYTNEEEQQMIINDIHMMVGAGGRRRNRFEEYALLYNPGRAYL